MMQLKAVVLSCAVHSAHEDTLTNPPCVCLDQFLTTFKLTYFICIIFPVCMYACFDACIHLSFVTEVNCCSSHFMCMYIGVTTAQCLWRKNFISVSI